MNSKTEHDGQSGSPYKSNLLNPGKDGAFLKTSGKVSLPKWGNNKASSMMSNSYC